MSEVKVAPKKYRVMHVRISDEEYSMLLGIQSETGELFSEILRKALRFYFNFLKRNK